MNPRPAVRGPARLGAGAPGPGGPALRDSDVAPHARVPRVAIVGAGFGGLYAAFRLRGHPVDVTLIDRRNYHLFQPLLYQVATAGLSPGDIAQPIRHILGGSGNVRVLLGEAVAVDLGPRCVRLTDASVEYDYVIVAAGAGHSYFGHDEWRPLAPGLKDLDDALEIRRRVLLAFERAERESDPARRQALLTFVIVGGGPTGVELAGALVEVARDALAREFRVIDPARARIVLLEAAPRILAGFHESLSRAAAERLARLDVEVRVGAPVTAIRPGVVEAGSWRVAAQTVLWAAGVRASSLARTLGVPLDRAGRVLVEPDLSIPGHPEAFVVGDLAATTLPDGRPVPGLAPVAIQGGRHAADQILRRARGEPTRPFRYRDRGMMATIGRHAAVAELGPVRLAGFAAWVIWLGVHVLSLIGLRNRILVVVEWAWAYFTHNRGVRLITGAAAALRPDGTSPYCPAPDAESLAQNWQPTVPSGSDRR